MKQSLRFSVLAGLAVGLLAAPVMGYGQVGDDSKTIPSLEYQQADVREALQALFKDIGASYSIAPEVQGQVTVSLRNVAFSTALENILRQVDATYRITGGVYEIVKREDRPLGTPGPDPIQLTQHEVLRRIPVQSADPELIALLLGAAKGTQTWNLPPEISSLRKTPQGGGMGSGMGGSMGGGMGGGLGGGGLGGGMGNMGGMGGLGNMGGGMGGPSGGGMGAFGGGGGGYGARG